MHVVFVSSELALFAKVGGLADVTASLPRALKRLGHRVSILLPLYGAVDRDQLALARTAISFEIPLDGKLRRAFVWKGRASGIPVYLIENDDYFARPTIYGGPEGDEPDNAARFAFFSRAALEASRALGLEPSLFHVHDWPTALVPVYQRLGSTPPRPTVLTIHNLAYQGIFPKQWMPRLELPWNLFGFDGLEFYDRLNFLKGGLIFSDRLTTVSPTYAGEIQGKELGFGLEGVVRARSDRLRGILNGIDPSDWHPGRDPALVASYRSNGLSGKAENKRALQRELGLNLDGEAPLLGFVGRLVSQKGIDLLVEAIPGLVSLRAQLAILGSGESDALASLQRLARRFPRQVRVSTGFQDELGRRIYAGADFFMMPSRYEPCGLGQMIALRYGTLPIVHRTGGLADSIRDLDEHPDGNGFSFPRYDLESFMGATRRALGHRRDSKSWKRIVARAMREDFSWKASAAAYVDVYRRAMGESVELGDG